MTEPTPNPSSPVSDEELLYRAVLNDVRFLPTDGQGERRVSGMAFNDTLRRPSVDRAVLCQNGANETRDRFRPGSGVLSLETGAVRMITATHGATGQVYGVDVEPVPLPENMAHAEIFGRPPFDTDNVFDRIKQALARIASVVLPPGDTPPT